MIKRLLFLIFLSLTSLQLSASQGSDPFYKDGFISAQMDFWMRVFTEHTDEYTLLHDRIDPTLVYSVVGHKGKNHTQREIIVKKELRKLREDLKNISKKKGKNLNRREKNVLSKIPSYLRDQLNELSRRVRYQQGMSNRVKAGLERSQLYLPHVKNAFHNLGLPEDLVYIPHVESSFNYRAYSRVGAAGVWQFMPETAKYYNLKMREGYDQRLDPVLASRSAARLLRDNYKVLKSWPLAIMAYNHGAYSLKRAVQKMKTTNITKILKNYQGRGFDYASKNFYASFLCMRKIAENPSKYFKNLHQPQPLKFSSVKVLKKTSPDKMKRVLGVSQEVLEEYNLAYRKSFFKKKMSFSTGMVVYFPERHLTELNKIEHLINDDLKSEKVVHNVKRGQSLHAIARQYKVRVATIVSFNQLKSSQIRPGMKLVIPVNFDV